MVQEKQLGPGGEVAVSSGMILFMKETDVRLFIVIPTYDEEAGTGQRMETMRGHNEPPYETNALNNNFNSRYLLHVRRALHGA